MEDRVAEVERKLERLIVGFEALVKNTDDLPEVLKLLTITSERTEVNRRDINALGTKVETVEHEFPILIQEANDRANTTSRWVLGISIVFSTSLFSYFALDSSAMKSSMIEMNKAIAIHNQKFSELDARYEFLEMD